MRGKQIFTGLLAIVMLTASLPTITYADIDKNQTVDKKVMSIEQAIQLAKENNMSLRQLISAKNKAMDSYSKSENSGLKIRSSLDAYYEFQKLDENGAKDDMSKIALEQYRAMFGGAPRLSFDQIYDKFIVPSEIVPYQVYVQFQGLKIDEPITVSSIEYQTKQLCYSILSYQHAISLVKDSIQISEKKLAEMETKYKVGTLSQSSLEIERKTLEKKILEYEKQQNDLKVLEEQFNLLLGQKYGTEVKLNDPGLIKFNKQVDYNNLVEVALNQRGDLKKSQLNIDALSFEVKTMSKYLRDEKLDRRVSADQRLLTAKLEHEALLNTIKLEVLSVYNDYKLAEEQLNVSVKKLAETEKQLVKIKQLFKTGYVKQLDVFGVELQVQNSKLNYETSIYEYNQKIDKLNRVLMHAVK